MKTKIGQWQKDIEEITHGVEDLLYSKYKIEELKKIIKANPFVMQKVGTFWEHYKLNYVFFAVSKIWHQIDEDKRSYSLINLLKDLLCHHTLITKKWWVSKNPLALSSTEFEEKFGSGKNLDPSIVCADIIKLKEATREVEKFRHKRIAHIDKSKGKKFSSKIRNAELEKAISAIERIVIKYQLLLNQSGWDSLTPVSSDDWQESFTKAWIQN